ncbi:hypothetical protein SJAV_00040 [Sulfurisphaera javensis]|uniref:Uncharacterized protein n=1 Tax=Sulfurisphaera javensis TaxID=2049879 RepID=A0AAT9GMD0_9CREN
MRIIESKKIDKVIGSKDEFSKNNENNERIKKMYPMVNNTLYS